MNKTEAMEVVLTVIQTKTQKLVTIPKHCNIEGGDKVVISKVIE